MQKLKRLRKERKLTQQNVAESLHISRQLYSFYENGKREPNIENLSLLADFFDVSIDYLLGRKEKNLSMTSLLEKLQLVDKETLDEIENYLDYIIYKKNKTK